MILFALQSMSPEQMISSNLWIFSYFDFNIHLNMLFYMLGSRVKIHSELQQEIPLEVNKWSQINIMDPKRDPWSYFFENACKICEISVF